MIQAATYNIRIQRRADFSLPLQFKTGAGSPMDFTGWTIASQIWNQERTVKFVDFSIIYINRAQGQVSLNLTSAQTAEITAESQYDVKLINPSGFAEYYLEGTVSISEGYTA